MTLATHSPSGQRATYSTDVTDEQWAILSPLLPPQPSGPGRRRRVDQREVLNALFYLTRTGCQWRLLPHDFPKWGAVRYYFDKWTDDGTWVRLNDTWRERLRTGRTAQPSAVRVDSQPVKPTAVGGRHGFEAEKPGQRAQTPPLGGYARPARLRRATPSLGGLTYYR